MAHRICNFLSKTCNYARRNCTISQHSNFSLNHASLQQEKSNVSFAGRQRYFFTENETEDLRPPNDKIKKHTWITKVRLAELITRMIHWGALIKKEHGKEPMAELPMSIRRKMLELENLIAPEMKNPLSVFDNLVELKKPFSYEVHSEYIEAKWLLILQKKDNPHVKQLIALMKAADVPQDVFIKSLSSYSFVLPEDIYIHARPLSEFKVEEIKSCLELQLGLLYDSPDLNLAIKAITHVLMNAYI